MVWSLWPHIHLASSLKLNLYKYALVFPCPISTAASFAVSVIFILVCCARMENIILLQQPCGCVFVSLCVSVVCVYDGWVFFV